MSGSATRPRLHLPAGSAGSGAYDLVITPETAGWGHCSLRVLTLPAGGQHRFATGDSEVVVLPLSGACDVTCDGERLPLRGRRDVFSAVSDMAYLPRDADVDLASADGGRFALAGARCERRLPVRYRPAVDVPVEVRGAGACSRQVNNFCSADSFAADRLIAVEVLTPAGNWSSWPPHKHDEDRPGAESELEEIYYFETRPVAAAAPGGSAGGEVPRGFAFHRVYGTPERPIDVLAEVRDGDAVLVPHGWHGPSTAAPGYDLYYLNVMAGPGAERTWGICDDPAHAWVRATWSDQEQDPRLPMTHAGQAR